MKPIQLDKTHRIKRADLLGNHVLEETTDGEKYETISEPAPYQEIFIIHKRKEKK